MEGKTKKRKYAKGKNILRGGDILGIRCDKKNRLLSRGRAVVDEYARGVMLSQLPGPSVDDKSL